MPDLYRETDDNERSRKHKAPARPTSTKLGADFPEKPENSASPNTPARLSNEDYPPPDPPDVYRQVANWETSPNRRRG